MRETPDPQSKTLVTAEPDCISPTAAASTSTAPPRNAANRGSRIISASGSGLSRRPSPRPRFAGEFHARSAFSFLRGANSPDELVARALQLGHSHLALTDHQGFYGSARAHQRANLLAGDGLGRIQLRVGATWELPDGSQVPVLCTQRAGYQSLSRSLTNHHLLAESALPRFAEVAPGSLIALSGDRDGPVCRPLLRGDRAGALRAAEALVRGFGQDQVFIEIFRHGLRDDARLNRALVDLADHLRLPLLASNAPLYATRADRRLADAFTCLRHGTTLDGAGCLLAINGERHLKSAAEMDALFADLPRALDGTRALAERLEFSLEDLGYRFPDFPDEHGQPLPLEEQTRRLQQLVNAGFHRIDAACRPAARAQLAREIDLIHRLGFSGYFLIVHDLMEFARSRGILAQGRGSAANSAVCFVLGITRVDPIKQKLLFERFLAEGQSSWPDIDIDFPSGDRREEVIQYVFARYGARGAAMTANVITYQPRSTFRELSKVLGFPASLADRFSSEGSSRRWDEHDTHGGGSCRANSPNGFSGNSSSQSQPVEQEEPGEHPHAEFLERIEGLIPRNHPRLPALTQLYHAALHLPRHLGQHSGGMIVCSGRLDAVVPIQPAAMPGRTIVQWDKDDCEDLGIIKIDLLGLGMLEAMEDMAQTCARFGVPDVLSQIDLEDPRVYDLMGRADTIGTFQVESRAQMATLPRFRPRTFYDVAMQVAIIRPGPIVGELVHPLIERRADPSQIDLIHPDCADILERTYGVALFQEQVLSMSMRMAGFSGREASELRRAISFKRSDERMIRISTKLDEGLRARGYNPEVRRKVIDSLGSFALYGFPESHALSFAWIAYASCWLKLHHPGAFYTGLINSQPMGFYSVHTLVQDARRHGLRLLPVSVVESEIRTHLISLSQIRFGLHRIKGLRRRFLEHLVDQRRRQPFTSLPDFLDRVRPDARQRRLLAQAGALNDLPAVEDRRNALWQSELPLHQDELPFAVSPPFSAAETTPAEAPSGPFDRAQAPPPPLPSPSFNRPLTPMTLPERLAADLATQGASVGPHPMKLWRQKANPDFADLRRARDLSHLRPGQTLRIGGLVICRQRPGTAKGHCFLSLEDETGIANLFVPRSTFQRLRLIIVTQPFLLATGHLQLHDEGSPTLFVTHLEPLPQSQLHHASPSHDFH